MAERVKFAGDPVPGETGVPGSQPTIPLSGTVAPTSVEMLDKEDEEEKTKNFRPKPSPKGADISDDDDDEEDEAGPAYSRERIGARIGQPVEEAQQVASVEETLDADDVVPCMFQRKVMLQDQGIMHTWEPGVHLVPVALAGRTMKERHWWLKRHKVRHTGPVQKNPAKDEQLASADDE